MTSTPRAKFLAAGIVLEFAESANAQFQKQKLGQPLAKTLRAKRASLEETVALYQQVSDYQVQEFATRAAYSTAQLYLELATELLNLPTPAGLNELEKEQYLVLLEEQAIPFEDLAISLHEANASRARQQIWDQWIAKSFEALAELLPARYRPAETAGTAEEKRLFWLQLLEQEVTQR